MQTIEINNSIADSYNRQDSQPLSQSTEADKEKDEKAIDVVKLMKLVDDNSNMKVSISDDIKILCSVEKIWIIFRCKKDDSIFTDHICQYLQETSSP